MDFVLFLVQNFVLMIVLFLVQNFVLLIMLFLVQNFVLMIVLFLVQNFVLMIVLLLVQIFVLMIVLFLVQNFVLMIVLFLVQNFVLLIVLFLVQNFVLLIVFSLGVRIRSHPGRASAVWLPEISEKLRDQPLQARQLPGFRSFAFVTAGGDRTSALVSPLALQRPRLRFFSATTGLQIWDPLVSRLQAEATPVKLCDSEIFTSSESNLGCL